MKSRLVVFSISILLIGALIFGAIGCTQSSSTTTQTTAAGTTTISTTTMPPTTEQDKYGGTIRILLTSSGEGNIGIPWEMRQNSGVIVPCIDHLIEMDFNGTPIPGLATEWQVADDGKSITLTLMEGVKFHDGTAFDADACKWNLDQWMNAHQAGTENWTSVDVVSPYVVRINLTEYRNTVFSSLAKDYFGPISPTAYEQNGHDWAEKHPCGTGPFKLISIDPDVGWSYERNDEYWQPGKPYLDAIEYKVVMDLNVAQMMLESGEAELMTFLGISGTEIKTALVDKGWQRIMVACGGYPFCLWPDSANAESPWSKKEVRLAADYALEKEVIALLGKGHWSPTWQLATPVQEFYDPSLTRPHNSDEARELLAEAGYTEGFDTTIYYDSTTPTDIMVAVQSYFKDVGINCELELIAISDAFMMVTQGWHNGLFCMPFGVNYVYMEGLEQYFSTSKFQFVSVLSTPETQAYIDAGLRARTIEEQRELNGQAVKYLFDEELTIPIFLSNVLGVSAPYVHDAGFYGTANWTPADCWLSK